MSAHFALLDEVSFSTEYSEPFAARARCCRRQVRQDRC